MRPSAPLPRALALLAIGVTAAACRRQPSPPPPAASASGTASAPVASAPVASASATPDPSAARPAAAAPPAEKADPSRYAWLTDASRSAVPAVTTLAEAIPAPPGWDRVAAPVGSFAAWLRDLPLAAPGTPVKSWRGEEVFGGDEEYVQAVLAIDVGKADLQQSADVILRFDAEWRWSQGKRDMAYLAATKDPLPYASYVQGKRVLAQGPHLYWVKQREPTDPNDRGAFRDYLDTVFIWANSTAVRMQSDPVPAKELAPGDFFLQRDKTGHALVVLDVVAKPSGEQLALLGQALTEAMNIHVLRPGRGTAWFSLNPPEPLLTPHTKAFAWTDLRRLRPVTPDAAAAGE